MNKPKNPAGTHRELWDQDSPFRYNRVEQQRQQDRREQKYRKRPDEYLEDDEDDDSEDWIDDSQR
jgi:hypothetical protein